MELGHIVAVALDGQPLASSTNILLQCMSEEKATGFETEPVSGNVKRIRNIGRNPWMIKALEGTVTFRRGDAGQLQVTALDLNGYPVSPAGQATAIRLRAGTIYYLLNR
jgi:hypothetical protein